MARNNKEQIGTVSHLSANSTLPFKKALDKNLGVPTLMDWGIR